MQEDATTKALLGKILGEIYRQAIKSGDGHYLATEADVFGLLNGIESEIDRFTPKLITQDQVDTVKAILAHFGESNSEEPIDYLEMESVLHREVRKRDCDVDTGVAITIMKWIFAGNRYDYVKRRLTTEISGSYSGATVLEQGRDV